MTKHVLRVTPENVHWGYLSADIKPAIVVDSGETVVIDSVNGGPADMAEVPFDLLPDHTLIHEKCSPRLGGHIITGPVGIRGAEPGDVLEVRVLDVQLRQPWGHNVVRPLRGTLPEDFPVKRLLTVPLDMERMQAKLPFGPTIPLQPFFGIMAVAPRKEYGAVSSVEPREFGGNIDNRELGKGATIFFPVQTPMALFSAGDGHAVQGDGEVCLTAIETAMTGTFQFFLHKKVPLTLPVAITATDVITMGFHEDLDDAARIALKQMIHLLSCTQGWEPIDAYSFCSMACNLRVTQLVDGNKGVHAMVAKELLGPIDLGKITAV
jgi:acetamidase/formamidase